MPTKKVSYRKPFLDDSAFALLRYQPPLTLFNEWFADAAAAIAQPEAMTLATATAAGVPQARTVLLKAIHDGGFVFFSHTNSRKGQALQENPHAALLFYWAASARQINIEGEIVALSRAQTAQYFATRPHLSRINAHASAQSQPIESPSAFAAKVQQTTIAFKNQEPPLPSHWGGYRLLPRRIEFWQEGEFRMHRRLVFFRQTVRAKWQSAFLQP